VTDLKIAAVLIVAAVLLHHRHHYRRHRRAGFGIWYSLRGPWGTRESVSKRF
jgi:hypothetical protein